MQKSFGVHLLKYGFVIVICQIVKCSSLKRIQIWQEKWGGGPGTVKTDKQTSINNSSLEIFFQSTCLFLMPEEQKKDPL